MDEYAHPVNVVAYGTTLCIPAYELALTNAWQSLTDDERLYVHRNMPRLFTAIFLAIKGIQRDQPTCDATGPRSGIPCREKGDHDTHVSLTVGGEGSSEVWR